MNFAMSLHQAMYLTSSKTEVFLVEWTLVEIKYSKLNCYSPARTDTTRFHVSTIYCQYCRTQSRQYTDLSTPIFSCSSTTNLCKFYIFGGERVLEHNQYFELRTMDHLIEVIDNLLFASFVEEVCTFFFWSSTWKHFQSRSVSSAPADTTVDPSGDMAMCNTRAVWPVMIMW